MSYMKQFEEALKTYGQQKDPAQAQYEAELMRPQDDVAHRGTIATIDALTGANFSSQLPKKESQKDRLAQLLQLRQGVEAQKLKGMGQLANMEATAADRAEQRRFQQQMYDLQLAKAKQKAMAGPKLGSEEKQKLGYTTTLLKELPKLQALYEKGDIARPGIAQVFGQNDAETIINALAENYGRLQSGGAISKDEEDRFKSRLGSMMDGKEIRLAKLKQIMDEIQDKHNLYGGGAFTQSGRMPTATALPGASGDDYDNMSDAELQLLLAGK